jgi:hypothetical protein
MFAGDVPREWICKVLEKTFTAPENRYLFQSKNPERFGDFLVTAANYCFTTTLETNRWYDCMGNREVLKTPLYRAIAISVFEKPMVTIEPILNFDLAEFLGMIKMCHPFQVNIGADSGNNHLPEPPKEKVLELIAELEKFTKVVIKKNLGRLIK